MPVISALKHIVGTGKNSMNWDVYWTTRTPSALVLTVLSDTSIKLDWTNAGAADFDGQSIEISTDGINYAEAHTVVNSGSNTASRITDLSGNNRHVLTVTANQMPSIITNNLNGHNAIRFDGSNNRLLSDAFTLNQPYTCFIVYQLITNGVNEKSLFGSKAAPNLAFCRYLTGRTEVYTGTAGQVIESLQSKDLSCLSLIINGASSYAFRNEVQSYLLTPGTGVFSAGLELGGYANNNTTIPNFDFYSLFIYPGALTNYQRLRIVEYLGNRYNSDFRVGNGVLGFQIEKFDNVFDNSVFYADKGTYEIRSGFSEYSFTTTDTFVRFSAIGDIYTHYAAFSQIAVYEDDVYIGRVKFFDAINEFGIALSSGSKKVTLVEGGQSSITGHVYPSVAGTYLTSVKLKNFTKVNESTVATKMVFIGDSISVGGDYATIPQQQAFARLFKVEDNISSACLAFGAAKLSEIATDATDNAVITGYLDELFANTTTRKIVVILIGTNDYAASVSAANFTTYYGGLLDAINVADGDIEIFCVSPTVRHAETSLLADYRTAISGLCTARSAFTTYINGGTILAIPGDFGADELHPTIAGSKKLKDAVDAVIFP